MLTDRGYMGQGEKMGCQDAEAQSIPHYRDRSENKQAQIMITSGTPFSMDSTR